MTSEYNLVLNPNKCKSIESGIVLSQGDFGAVFKIKVEELDTASTTCTIAFRKKSGSVEATGLTASAGVYSYALRGTELDTPGRVVCDLKFKEGTSKRISTASFIFDVVPDTLNGLHEEAHSYSDSILQMRQQIVEEARADLVKPMTYKGVVASVSNLPASGNANADFYIVSGNDHIYVWNGTIWTDAGPAVTQISIIDDNVIGDNTTWSSSKINRDLAELSTAVDISEYITMDDSNISETSVAYAIGKIVYVRIGLFAGWSGAKTVAKIRTPYTPIFRTFGWYSPLSSPGDAGKHAITTITPDGTMTTYLLSSLSTREYVDIIFFVR